MGIVRVVVLKGSEILVDTIKYPHRVKARKQHKCDNCNKAIEVGEEYECATYSCDGIIYDWRTCDRCKQYVEEALHNKNYSWDDGMSEEDFHNYMIEEHREIAEEWWGLNRKEIDMEIKEKYCKVCNHILDISKENVYQTRVENQFFHNVSIYDTTDCPYCGCQNLLKERYEKVRTKQ